jgi:hypothetical protein
VISSHAQAETRSGSQTFAVETRPCPAKPKKIAVLRNSPVLGQFPATWLTQAHTKSITTGANPAPLPPSVEAAYRQKCIDLRRRLKEVEEFNDAARLRIQRSKRQMMKMRLERAFLLERLEGRTSANVEDSDGSPSPPPTVSSHYFL